jgi:excisionase family DNA binding protein
MTIKEAAAELRLRDVTIRAWIAGRRIASVHLGRRVFVPVDEIERVLAEGLVPRAVR